MSSTATDHDGYWFSVIYDYELLFPSLSTYYFTFKNNWGTKFFYPLIQRKKKSKSHYNIFILMIDFKNPNTKLTYKLLKVPENKAILQIAGVFFSLSRLAIHK